MLYVFIVLGVIVAFGFVVATRNSKAMDSGVLDSDDFTEYRDARWVEREQMSKDAMTLAWTLLGDLQYCQFDNLQSFVVSKAREDLVHGCRDFVKSKLSDFVYVNSNPRLTRAILKIADTEMEMLSGGVDTLQLVYTFTSDIDFSYDTGVFRINGPGPCELSLTLLLYKSRCRVGVLKCPSCGSQCSEDTCLTCGQKIDSSLHGWLVHEINIK